MKSYQVATSKEAERELREIERYISRNYGKYYAQVVMLRIHEKFSKLSVMPSVYSKREDLLDLRLIKAGKYSVLFRVDEEKAIVKIVHVIHSKRNIRAIVKRS